MSIKIQSGQGSSKLLTTLIERWCTNSLSVSMSVLPLMKDPLESAISWTCPWKSNLGSSFVPWNDNSDGRQHCQRIREVIIRINNTNFKPIRWAWIYCRPKRGVDFKSGAFFELNWARFTFLVPRSAIIFLAAKKSGIWELSMEAASKSRG
jgi:hypothetical protein